MQTMKVYRVERNGIGPFRDYALSNDDYDKWKAATEPAMSMPTPYNDNLDILFHEDHRFGTRSLGELSKWFSDEAIALLAEIGYSIVEYEVEWRSVMEGDHQVAFDIRSTIGCRKLN